MNALQHESSPYLLQHAGNPVDWYAWKPEVLERAKRENKPILLSIGYSSCHWCHVMERESFENKDIADYMNEHFINIKVDREERPDVDAIYMEACQILTGSGGWPLNCFLTPDARPFYAGTYFPPRPAHNRPSWLQVLQHMSKAWETEREKVEGQADRLMDYIRKGDRPPGAGKESTGQTGQQVFETMKSSFDTVYGGFGAAPKFPSTMAIHFLFSWYWLEGEEEALSHALFSLDKMVDGGIYDQIGGGFARYAVDAQWLVPHFEKMLYDNALLLKVLSEAVQLLQSLPTRTSQQEARLLRYKEVIVQTMEFLNREMKHPDGGYYSALDADSEGEEGKYYVWTRDELDLLLEKDAPLFCEFYDVDFTGNWENKSILWRKVPLETFALNKGMEAAELNEKLVEAGAVLMKERQKRVRPGLDDKVLLGWNALLNTGMSTAAAALKDPELQKMAEENMAFLIREFEQADGRLHHNWKDGKSTQQAFLDDYAFVIESLLILYQNTHKAAYLTRAEKYTEQVLSYFWEEESGLFYFTPEDQKDIIVRKTDFYDNATPSGNSTMVHNLQKLAILLDRSEWMETAEKMLGQIQGSLEKYPLSFERWASAALHRDYGLYELAILGNDAIEKAREVNAMFVPGKVVVASTTESDDQPLLAGKPAEENAGIYVCRNYACLQPIYSSEEFRDQYARREK